MHLSLLPSYHPSKGGEGTLRGSLLLEAILSIALFSIFLTAVGLALIVGERSTVSGGDRVRGVFLAEQAIEGARFLRDTDFDLLIPGTHGISLSAEGEWQLLPSPAITEDGYTVSLEILSRDDHWMEAIASVTWDFGETRADTISFVTFLTDWRREIPIGNWSSFHSVASLPASGAPHHLRMIVANGIAYVAGTQEEGGPGLMLFDVTDPSAPVRVAESFDLGASAYDLALDGTRLFIATDDPGGEIKLYDVGDPASLTSDNLLDSHDIPGSAGALSVAFYGSVVYAGTASDPDEDEFFTVYLEEDESMTALDSFSIDGDVNDISLRDGYAYLASGLDSTEFLVLDVFDPEDLQFAPGTGMDLPDIYDGLSLSTFGTSAVLTRASGTDVDEMIVYSVADSPVPSPPPGPWAFEGAGDITGFTVDPGGTYGFSAGNAAAAQIRSFNMKTFTQGGNPLLFSFDAGAAVRDVFYDWQTDRLFAVTDSSLLVFAPGP